jgi:hypothetical protein
VAHDDGGLIQIHWQPVDGYLNAGRHGGLEVSTDKTEIVAMIDGTSAVFSFLGARASWIVTYARHMECWVDIQSRTLSWAFRADRQVNKLGCLSSI